MQTILCRGSQGKHVRLLRQVLVKQLGSEAQGFGRLDKGDVLDADTEVAARRWQAGAQQWLQSQLQPPKASVR